MGRIGLRFRSAAGRLLELSGVVDLEPVADGGCYGLKVVGVGADDEVVTAQSSLDHAGVDDVGGVSACRYEHDCAGLSVVHDLDIATGQQPRELDLAGRATQD